ASLAASSPTYLSHDNAVRDRVRNGLHACYRAWTTLCFLAIPPRGPPGYHCPGSEGTTMPLRLGMLGMWHTHAHGVVRQVAEHPREFRLVGFYDPDGKVVAERRKAWTPLLKAVRIFDKPEDLLQQPLDGVVVEGRVFENVRLARLAIDRGKPVLLEKPAGDNFDSFRRLVDAAQRRHLHVQMLYLF